MISSLAKTFYKFFDRRSPEAKTLHFLRLEGVIHDGQTVGDAIIAIHQWAKKATLEAAMEHPEIRDIRDVNADDFIAAADELAGKLIAEFAKEQGIVDD